MFVSRGITVYCSTCDCNVHRDSKERYVCFKFCFKLGRHTTETSETLKVPSGQQTVGKTQIFYWFSKFRSSVTSAEDAGHLERISTSKTGASVEQVKEVLLKNRGMTLYEVANVFGISFVSVSSENFGR